MIHFPKGGNWQQKHSMNYHCSTGWGVQWEHPPIWKENIEGLPDRWVKIIEMTTRDIRLLLMGRLESENHEPEVHCVKEGLWTW